MILTRKQFAAHFRKLDSRLGNKHSALWEPENRPGMVPNKWFVCVRPVGAYHGNVYLSWDKDGYWEWCNSTLAGQVSCYSSDWDNKKEWWGFSNYDDIAMWLLRWS